MSQNNPNDVKTSRAHLFPLLRWVGLVAFAAAILVLGIGGIARNLHITSMAAPPDEAGGEGSSLSGDFRAMGLDGSLLGPADFVGKPVIVDFWATWCAPCRLQAEHLEVLHAELGDEVGFLAVSLGESEETVRGYVERTPFSYPVLIDPDDSITNRYEIYSLPTVMIIDEAGKVIFMQPGVSNIATLKAALAKTT